MGKELLQEDIMIQQKHDVINKQKQKVEMLEMSIDSEILNQNSNQVDNKIELENEQNHKINIIDQQGANKMEKQFLNNNYVSIKLNMVNSDYSMAKQALIFKSLMDSTKNQ